MKTLMLKASPVNGMLSLQNPGITQAGVSPSGTHNYLVKNIPDEIESATVLRKANFTCFLDRYEAEYDELGFGKIVRK